MDKNIEQKLDNFFSHYPEYRFAKGETIIASSESIRSIYYLKEGFVRQRVITNNAEEVTIHIFKPISLFPLMIVLSEKENEYDFVAMDDMILRKSPVDDMLQFLKENPDVLFDLTRRFAEGINGLSKKIVSLTFTDSQRKLASLLFYFANRFGTPHEQGIMISSIFTHADIASWIGITRETVSRCFSILEKKGIVIYEKENIFIKDIDLLEKEMN